MNLNGTEWSVKMDRNFIKDQESFGTALKIWQKNTCGGAALWWPKGAIVKFKNKNYKAKQKQKQKRKWKQKRKIK